MNAEIEGQDIVAPQAEVIPTVSGKSSGCDPARAVAHVLASSAAAASASKRDAEELGVEVPEAKKSVLLRPQRRKMVLRKD